MNQSQNRNIPRLFILSVRGENRACGSVPDRAVPGEEMMFLVNALIKPAVVQGAVGPVIESIVEKEGGNDSHVDVKHRQRETVVRRKVGHAAPHHDRVQYELCGDRLRDERGNEQVSQRPVCLRLGRYLRFWI